MTHYERLRVAPDASTAEVRVAYRRAARIYHPDANGDRSARQMAEVNEAWRVLRDPERRRDYDLSLPMPGEARRVCRAAPRNVARSTPSSTPAPFVEPARNPLARYQSPARFPWRFMAVLASIGILVVLLGVIINKPAKPQPPDNLLQPGSCVVLQPNRDAAEVNCTDPHDGVVDVVVGFDQQCPPGDDPHRDRQGRGFACIRA